VNQAISSSILCSQYGLIPAYLIFAPDTLKMYSRICTSFSSSSSVIPIPRSRSRYPSSLNGVFSTLYAECMRSSYTYSIDLGIFSLGTKLLNRDPCLISLPGPRISSLEATALSLVRFFRPIFQKSDLLVALLAHTSAWSYIWRGSCAYKIH
jgi:hypothetical protein